MYSRNIYNINRRVYSSLAFYQNGVVIVFRTCCSVQLRCQIYMKKFIQGYTLRYTIYYKKYNDITTKWAFQGGETNTELKRVKAFQKH